MTKKPAVKEAIKKKEAMKAKAGKPAKENKTKATVASKAKVVAESKAKIDKKAEVKKKTAAVVKEKEPSSASALSSDPIEDDEIVKPAKGRDSTSAPAKKGISAAKVGPVFCLLLQYLCPSSAEECSCCCAMHPGRRKYGRE